MAGMSGGIIPLALCVGLLVQCGGFPGRSEAWIPRMGGLREPERGGIAWGLLRRVAGASGGALRLRGGLDSVQLHEYEAVLDCLQRPDATPQQRHHAQQFALSLQNPVDLSEVPHAADAAGRRQAAVAKRLSQLQHILDHSQSPTAQVRAYEIPIKQQPFFLYPYCTTRADLFMA